jgi:hypothetical protein
MEEEMLDVSSTVTDFAVKGIESDLRERVAGEKGTVLRLSVHWSDSMDRFFGTALSVSTDNVMGHVAQTTWKFDGAWFIQDYLILTPEEDKIIADLKPKAQRT